MSWRDPASASCFVDEDERAVVFGCASQDESPMGHAPSTEVFEEWFDFPSVRIQEWDYECGVRLDEDAL